MKNNSFVVEISNSDMVPVLSQHDQAVFEKITFTKLRINDVVYGEQKGKTLIQRIIYIKNNYIIVQADKNTNTYVKLTQKGYIGLITGIKHDNDVVPLDSIYFLQSSIYWKEIEKVTKIFYKNKIEFVFLKGLPLHLFYEKAIPRRIYADCDILVEKMAMQKVERIFNNLGYKKSNTESLIGKEMSEKAEISFTKNVDGGFVCFDVHREVVFLMSRVGDVDRLYPKKLFNSLNTKFLDEKRYRNINKQKYPLLSQSNLVVYLLLHLFNHNFKGTYRYYFLVNILKTVTNYEEIRNTIKQYKLENFIYPSILLLNIFFLKNCGASKIISKKNMQGKKVKYIEKVVKNISVFQDDDISKGKHFRLLFSLSPQPLWVKLLVFADTKIIFSIFWVFTKRILN